MARRSSRSPRQKPIIIQVRFEGGEDIPVLFANHVFVVTGPDGFLVSFAQSHPPYTVNLTPEDLQREGVAAKIIAKLLIPPNRMREFAEIFSKTLEQSDAPGEERPDDNNISDTKNAS